MAGSHRPPTTTILPHGSTTGDVVEPEGERRRNFRSYFSPCPLVFCDVERVRESHGNCHDLFTQRVATLVEIILARTPQNSGGVVEHLLLRSEVELPWVCLSRARASPLRANTLKPSRCTRGRRRSSRHPWGRITPALPKLSKTGRRF